MPKPPPDYLPDLVLDRANEIGLKANQFAEKLGFEPGRFYTYFQGSHAHLKRYAQLADLCNLSLEEMRQAADSGQLKSIVETRAKKEGLSVKRFASVHGMSPAWLYNLIGSGSLNALNGDIEMATALKVDLDTIRELVGI